MHNRIAILILCLATVAAPGLAQTPPLPLPAPVEKELAARATKVTEVTLDKNMLGFASGVMNNKNPDQAQARQMVDGLDGIYVRKYEFDKEGQYSPAEVDRLRAYYETGEWTPIVRDIDHKTGETSDVMVKMVNGQSRGMFVLSAKPREISIVLLLGNVSMDQLGELKGLSGLGALGGVEKESKGAAKEKMNKAKEKDKTGSD